MSNPNLQRLEELASADPSLVSTLLTMFYEQAPDLMNQIATHAGAKQGEETHKAAHTLKGVCLNLGFNNMADICKQMEEAAKTSNFDAINNLYTDCRNELVGLLPILKEYESKIAA